LARYRLRSGLPIQHSISVFVVAFASVLRRRGWPRRAIRVPEVDPGPPLMKSPVEKRRLQAADLQLSPAYGQAQQLQDVLSSWVLRSCEVVISQSWAIIILRQDDCAISYDDETEVRRWFGPVVLRNCDTTISGNCAVEALQHQAMTVLKSCDMQVSRHCNIVIAVHDDAQKHVQGRGQNFLPIASSLCGPLVNLIRPGATPPADRF
jgi:hypothetical protein